jgi:hypothetical protein
MLSSAVQITVIFLANARSILPEDWRPLWIEQETWLKTKASHEAQPDGTADKVGSTLKHCYVFCPWSLCCKSTVIASMTP